jgi:tetratricopeptide (TPR) repeat protein
MKRGKNFMRTPRGGDNFRKEDLFDNPIDFEMDFYEGVLQGDPENAEILSLLGNLYTQAGKYDKGLEIDQKLVRMRPEDSLVHYNLACSLALLKRAGEALDELERAIDLGYNDYIHLRSDHDLDNLRAEARFKTLVKRLLQKIQ